MAMSKRDKIAAVELEIEQLLNQKKELIAQQKEIDRKDRTNRLCKRGGYIESVLPDTISLTNEQFQELMKRTLLTDYARRILSSLLPPKPQGAENTTETLSAQSAESVPASVQNERNANKQ
jgi:hypothetical protein